MTPEIFIKRQCGATKVERREVLQSLWSGYGEITRYAIYKDDKIEKPNFVIVKNCTIPNVVEHPRGWQSEHAHNRKVHSYEVEQNWYQHWAEQCRSSAYVPISYGDFFDGVSNQRLTILEDLDAAGYACRYQNTLEELFTCIDWLAAFHACFIYDTPPITWPQGLWQKGTYWHLSTRQDEWQAMETGSLKDAAASLSARLDNARFKTLVHGDAKVANFCFSADGKQTAAVDFQYVGGGVGVQDLAYLLGSALPENELDKHLSYLLDHYFAELARKLMEQGESQAFAQSVVEEWQMLFLIAWADFQRFIMGWAPTHHKNTTFSRDLTHQALTQLKSIKNEENAK